MRSTVKLGELTTNYRLATATSVCADLPSGQSLYNIFASQQSLGDYWLLSASFVLLEVLEYRRPRTGYLDGVGGLEFNCYLEKGSDGAPQPAFEIKNVHNYGQQQRKHCCRTHR